MYIHIQAKACRRRVVPSNGQKYVLQHKLGYLRVKINTTFNNILFSVDCAVETITIHTWRVKIINIDSIHFYLLECAKAGDVIVNAHHQRAAEILQTMLKQTKTDDVPVDKNQIS